MKRFQTSVVIVAGLVLAACGQKQDQPVEEVSTADEQPTCSAQPVADVQVVEIAPGLTSRTFSTGCGEAATAGQTVVVHYTGWILDLEAENQRGAKFDSSRDRGQHFSFPLGAGRVIKGWDQGVAGMMIGEVRELTIAPELAYGDRQIGNIAPGSTLVFEVELFELVGANSPAE